MPGPQADEISILQQSQDRGDFLNLTERAGQRPQGPPVSHPEWPGQALTCPVGGFPAPSGLPLWSCQPLPGHCRPAPAPSPRPCPATRVTCCARLRRRWATLRCPAAATRRPPGPAPLSSHAPPHASPRRRRHVSPPRGALAPAGLRGRPLAAGSLRRPRALKAQQGSAVWERPRPRHVRPQELNHRHVHT